MGVGERAYFVRYLLELRMLRCRGEPTAGRWDLGQPYQRTVAVILRLLPLAPPQRYWRRCDFLTWPDERVITIPLPTL
jgi:hypothetical protein